MKTQRSIAVAAILGALVSGVAYPCTIEVRSPKWLFRHSQTTFTGKLTEIRPSDDRQRFGAPDYKLVFHVERYWKGVTAPEVVLHTNDLGTGCPLALEAGREYLIYADKYGAINRLSRPLESAKKDLQEIGPGKEFKKK